MTDQQLYQQLLGLTTPWSVQTVEVDPNRCEVRVHVAAAPETCWPCPECQRECPGYDAREERRWRHLDSCGFETWLLARVPRVHCPTHGVKTIAVPWAGPYSRFTTAFACFAVAVLQATQQQARAAALLRITPDEVAYLMHQVVEGGLARRRASAAEGAPGPERLTLDEKHYSPGQCYLTVLGDPAAQRVWEVADGRERATVTALLQTCLTAAQREAVRAVALDLWQGFRSACQEVLPQARLVYDRFHAAQELNHALDLTRRAEHKRLRQGARAPRHRKHGASVLSGTRFWWLRAAETLPPEQLAVLEALTEQGLETGRVWKCKEAFRAFFTQEDVAAGRVFFARWATEARAVGNTHLTAVVAQFEKHLEKLLAYLETGLTNSFGEYLNGRLQTLRERARGFRNAAAYRIAIMFHLGKLDLCPQRFP